ncbi:pseudouridine synthase [uncultured Mailhella sp.]|uniref:pseudouridine synthase n=1 Tax=uncultured Mailhella sp. TaxID=1981031 RepID=UPI0025FEEE73|nr:pseudouridine synthase [uncultured Mailhella sp.]
MTYGKSVLIAIDQLVNALLAGWPDETLSSRAWRWEKNGRRSWPRRAIDRIFFMEKDHCRNSFESERARRQLPPELRTG